MPRMNELEENTLRTLMSRFREQNPEEFINLVSDTLFIRCSDESLTAFHHKDNENHVDGTIVVFKGGQVAKWADEALKVWTSRLKDLQEDSDAE